MERQFKNMAFERSPYVNPQMRERTQKVSATHPQSYTRADFGQEAVGGSTTATRTRRRHANVRHDE